MRLNKSEFIKFTNTETGIPMAQINMAIDIFTNAVISAMAAGNDVKLVGFGTFKLKKRAARIGRNLKTNEAVNIPECIIPIFEPGLDMKATVLDTKQYISR